MKKLLKIIGGCIGLCALVIAGLVLAEVDFSNDPNLDDFVEAKMEALEARGLAVVFIKDGDISWSNNYGYADVEAEKEVDEETLFQIASISKLVTGVAAMQLVEKGLLDLDAPINRYLPFHIANPHYPDTQITARMLLQHTSSLIDDDTTYRSTFTIPSGAPDPAMTLEELVRRYYLKGGALYNAETNFAGVPPGEARSYSNVAFGLLGFLVEQVSGQAFNVYCNEHIFRPLGMTSTGWFSTEINIERMATLYDGSTQLKPYAAASYPDGGLRTTIIDFSKFMIAMMNGGAYQGHRILQAATLQEMLPDRPEDTLVWEPDVFRELLVDTKGRPVPGHLGGDPGIATFAGFNPHNGTGLIVFMNGSPSLISPSPLLMLKMFNYRAPYKRLATEAGLL